MRIISYGLLSVGIVLTTSCSKPPAPPQARVAPTPHPATGAGEHAVRLYPDLAVKTSHFRRTFDEMVEHARTTSPKTLTSVDWPLTMARKTAAMLGVSEFRATPAPEPYNPLQRGAYDRRRAFGSRAQYETDLEYQRRMREQELEIEAARRR